MRFKKKSYPVVIGEYIDDNESTKYYVASSPNIPGMVTQANSFNEAIINSEDAIITMLNGHPLPEMKDASKWKLEENERLVYISVDLSKIDAESKKTIQKSITIPKFLNELAKNNDVNVSELVTKTLAKKFNYDLEE